MAFISYAQNFEDVMLWRALKHIDKGFYIDVGSAWPELHSVTKAFYDYGWRGINIEPNPSFRDEYLRDRKNDTNLFVALGDAPGESEIYFVTNTGLSSLRKNIAESHLNSGRAIIKSKVEVKTLASICEQYAKNRDIHFLKIDVEGFETDVIKGNNWERFRPWILVIESTIPMSQVENYLEWEQIILKANYQFAYGDGLNRFYVAREHSDLLPVFKYPPNIFDSFTPINQVLIENEVKQLNLQILELENKLKLSEKELQQIYSSVYWKITLPLRHFLKK